MLTAAAIALGAGAIAGAGALWPLLRDMLGDATRTPPELPHRPDPEQGPSPRRHRGVNAHTGSLPAAAILAALKAGQSTEQVIAGITRRGAQQDQGR